jgi:hypothetical protein
MANYIPSPRDWVREQVELYESSGGTEGTTLRALTMAIATSSSGRRAGHQRIQFGCTICASCNRCGCAR